MESVEQLQSGTAPPIAQADHRHSGHIAILNDS